MSVLRQLFLPLCEDELVHILSFLPHHRQRAIISTSPSLKGRFRPIDATVFDKWNLDTVYAKHWASIIQKTNELVSFQEDAEFCDRLCRLIVVATQLETPSSKSDMEIDFVTIRSYLQGAASFWAVADFVTHFRTIRRVLLKDDLVLSCPWVFLIVKCLPSLTSVVTPWEHGFVPEYGTQIISLLPNQQGSVRWANLHKGKNSLLYKPTTRFETEEGSVYKTRKCMLDLNLLLIFYTKNRPTMDLKEWLDEKWLASHQERSRHMHALLQHCDQFKLSVKEWYILLSDYTQVFDAIVHKIRHGHTKNHYDSGTSLLGRLPIELTSETAQLIIHLAEKGFRFDGTRLDHQTDMNIYHLVTVKHNVYLHGFVELLDFDFVRDAPSDSIVFQEIVVAVETHSCSRLGRKKTMAQLSPRAQPLIQNNLMDPLLLNKVISLLTPSFRQLLAEWSLPDANKRPRVSPIEQFSHKKPRIQFLID